MWIWHDILHNIQLPAYIAFINVELGCEADWFYQDFYDDHTHLPAAIKKYMCVNKTTVFRLHILSLGNQIRLSKSVKIVEVSKNMSNEDFLNQ
jgi:hypothetical protein